jgi:hypothetical protein
MPYDLERDPIKLNRITLSFRRGGRIFYGEPVSTSPENALGHELIKGILESEKL